MADHRGLLDLPKELLAMILKYHFEQVKVGIIYPHELHRRKITFSSLMLSCKTLSQTAQRAFTENAEVQIHTRDVRLTEELRRAHLGTFLRSVEDATIPIPTPTRARHPVRAFRHIASTLFAFLRLMDEEKESDENPFPKLEHLVVIDILNYGRRQYDPEQLGRILDLTGRCASRGIKLHACICIFHLQGHNLETAVGKFKFVLTDDGMIRPFTALISSRRFYRDVKKLLEKNFQVPTGALDRFLTAWESHNPTPRLAGFAGFAVVVNQGYEDGLIWRAKLSEPWKYPVA